MIFAVSGGTPAERSGAIADRVVTRHIPLRRDRATDAATGPIRREPSRRTKDLPKKMCLPLLSFQ
jgi:hypothetical protein